MTVVAAEPSRVRFRRSGALWVAALLFFVSGLPLAASSWWLVPVILIPMAVALWSWRSGVDANADGLRVRRLLGSRMLPWARIDGFAMRGRTAFAMVAGGTPVALPAVRREDLPTLIAAGGTELVTGDEDGDEPAEDEAAAQ